MFLPELPNCPLVIWFTGRNAAVLNHFEGDRSAIWRSASGTSEARDEPDALPAMSDDTVTLCGAPLCAKNTLESVQPPTMARRTLLWVYLANGSSYCTLIENTNLRLTVEGA